MYNRFVKTNVQYFLQLYPPLARNSPFILDWLNDYYLGNVDDMAAWTENIWNRTVIMLDNGSEYEAFLKFKSLCLSHTDLILLRVRIKENFQAKHEENLHLISP